MIQIVNKEKTPPKVSRAISNIKRKSCMMITIWRKQVEQALNIAHTVGTDVLSSPHLVHITKQQKPTFHIHYHQVLSSITSNSSILRFYMFEFDGTHSTSIGPPCHVWSVTTSCAQIYKPSSSNNQHLALNQPADTTDFPTFKSKLHVPDCTGVPEKFRFTQSLKGKNGKRTQ